MEGRSTNYIRSLLLKEYCGNICANINLNIISKIINDIDEEHNGIAISEYNIPYDKFIVIKDLCREYYPNHRTMLLRLYYHCTGLKPENSIQDVKIKIDKFNSCINQQINALRSKTISS